ncbi:hypothetical protein EIMP300_32750 [Escherichia coli]|uniref:PurM-like C-terminal domain-containing protein n=1 Tax=Escherichia coli TaxID=562 RepID=A0A8S0FMZ7_ECOLX|nr:hypothetical protein EIMP300_32750 [Escherichia coli]
MISAFARVEDVRHTITPQLSTEDNALLLIDLGKGNNALGATALAQVYRQLGDKPADVRDVAQLKGFYDAIQALVAQRKLLAYHDRSDGGLLVTLAEMAFAGHCGIDADIASLGDDRLAALFNEELGAVIQVRAADREAVEAVLAQHGLADCVHYVGQAVSGDRFVTHAARWLLPTGRLYLAKAAPRCVSGGQKLPGRCSACVTTRSVPIRNTRRNQTTPIRA